MEEEEQRFILRSKEKKVHKIFFFNYRHTTQEFIEAINYQQLLIFFYQYFFLVKIRLEVVKKIFSLSINY